VASPAILRVARTRRHHLDVPEEMGIYRGEVATIMGALADIRVDLEYIRWLLEDDDEAEEEEDT
jgi:hypothetical protein